MMKHRVKLTLTEETFRFLRRAALEAESDSSSSNVLGGGPSLSLKIQFRHPEKLSKRASRGDHPRDHELAGQEPEEMEFRLLIKGF